MRFLEYRFVFPILFGAMTFLIHTTASGQQAVPAPFIGKTIPFKFEPPLVPLPVVSASLDGGAPAPFLLDSGTTADIILSPEYAQKLGLKGSAGPVVNGSVSSKTVKVTSITLKGDQPQNDIRFHVDEAYVVDLGPTSASVAGAPLAGIIGYGLLSTATTQIDFAAKQILISTSPHPPLKLADATTIPIKVDEIGYATIPVTVSAGHTFQTILDTGDTGATLPLACLPYLKPTELAYRSIGQMVDALYLSPSLAVPSVNLGTLQVDNVILNLLPNFSSFGVSVLARFKVTIDGPNNQLLLEPSGAPGPPSAGWSGMQIDQISGDWVVTNLTAGSPASAAGLVPGDRITSINGTALSGLSTILVKSVGNGLAGVPSKLEVVHQDGTQAEVTFTPDDQFAAPKPATYGLIMKKPNAKPWQVVNVLTGSPAALAGILENDEITQINGSPTPGMAVMQAYRQIMAPHVQLTVVHPGKSAPVDVQLDAP